MEELFTPSAVPLGAHDAANPSDDSHIEVGVTERAEQAVAASNRVSAETSPQQKSTDPPPKRLSHGSVTSSVAFCYKDLYGSDDEMDFIDQNSFWKHRTRQRQSNHHYNNKKTADYVEVGHDQIDFSHGSRRASLTSESGDSMVSVSMGGIIASINNGVIPTQSDEVCDEYNKGQKNGSAIDKGEIKHADEPRASLLISAVESLKQIPLFGGRNKIFDVPQQLGSEKVKQETTSNNHADESGHSESSLTSSHQHPLHISQSEQSSVPSGRRSDSYIDHRKSGGIPFFGRFQKQTYNDHDTINSQEEVKSILKPLSTASNIDVDDDTPSTSDLSPDPPPKPKEVCSPNTHQNETRAHLSLLESMAQSPQMAMDENLVATPATSNEIMGASSQEDSNNADFCTDSRESLLEIFSAALSNDEDGARKSMGESQKNAIIEKLVMLAKLEKEHTRGHDDSSSGSPRFRPSIVEDFSSAVRRDSFQRRMSMSIDGSSRMADSQDTLDWASPVSSIGSPKTEDVIKAENKNDNMEKETVSVDAQSKMSKEGSNVLDLTGRNSDASYVEEVDPLLDANIEWPTSFDSSNLGSDHIQRQSHSSSRRSSQKSWLEHRRASVESEPSMSSLESFASTTNRLESKKKGTLASVQSGESMSYGDNEYQVEIEDLNESTGNVVTYPSGVRQLSRNSFKAEKKETRRTSDGEGSLSIGDFDGNSSSSGRPSGVSSGGLRSLGRLSSGLGGDVPLLLNSSTSLLSGYSTDGIEHIDPSAADTDDFDFAMTAYADAIKYGHFDVHAALNGDSSSEDNDHLLAAKAYMGLGYTRQCRGELASSLDAYMKALELCGDKFGLDDPIHAIIEYACGNVLNEMERYLDASFHFRKALRFYKSRESDGDDARVNILFIEGMMFSVMGEAKRALTCLREGLRLYQSSQRPLNLKLASVMCEMGSLLSQNGEYIDSASFFKFALHVRKSSLGDSFVVARNHYSLGVTLATQEVFSNISTEAFSHFEEALRICKQEFEGDNIQASVIIHAMGVLKERKGDFLAASNWFKGERDMLISLFGEDHDSVASVSSDLGTCHFNVGKYESARNMFQDTLRIVTLSEADTSLKVADVLYKIASCEESLCDFDDALENFYRVKEIRQSHFGLENSLVVQTMLRIGNVLLCKGEATAALECFDEVLGIGYATESVNAIEVANALYGRGCAQFCGFLLSDAMKSFSESLNWKLAALGENDPLLACIFYQMAHVHVQQGETEEAITYFEEYARLLKLDKQRNLHDNAEVCFTEGIIAKMRGNFEGALSFYRTSLSMFDTLFNGIHEKIASIHFEIGCVLSELGDLKESLHHFQLCLFKRRKLLGIHVDVATVLLEISSIYTYYNDFESAASCLEESDRIWKTKLRGNDEKLTSVLVLSGKRWKTIQCYKEAEANLEQALEMSITMHGQNHDLVAEILLDLGELLQEITQIQQVSNRNVCIQYFFDKLVPMSLPSGFFLF